MARAAARSDGNGHPRESKAASKASSGAIEPGETIGSTGNVTSGSTNGGLSAIAGRARHDLHSFGPMLIVEDPAEMLLF